MAQALGAAHPRQRHRPRPDAARMRARKTDDFDAQVDGLILKRGPAACRIRRHHPLSLGGALGDRPDDRARRRPASCMADAGCDRHGGMSPADQQAQAAPSRSGSDDMRRLSTRATRRRGEIVESRSRAVGPGHRLHRDRLERACRRRRRHGRRRGHPDAGQAAAQRARRLPHDECGRRRALCRQGAQPEEARHQLRAGPLPHQPHRPHGARDRRRWSSSHPHRDRSAAARSQPHQALAAALQRAAARRQVVSLHPAHRRSRRRPASSSIAARARARATISARSPRPARSGAPSIRCSGRSCSAPARTPSTRAARGPACSTRSSAAPGPAPARSRIDGLCRAGRRGEGFPVRPQPEGEDRDLRRRCSRPPKTSISSAPPSIATGWRRCRMSRATRASTRKRSRRPTSSPSTRKAARSASRCSSSAPARTGATAPISPRPIRRWRRRKCWARSSRSSTTTSRCPRTILLSHRRRGAGTAGRGALHPRRPQGVDLGAAARREEGSGRPRAAECARGARPPAGRNLDAGAAARRLRRDLRPGEAAASHRGLRQLAHHGHQRRRRHDRRRAGRLREEPVPQVQHPLDRDHARRRFRHDARGDGAALLAAAQGAWRCAEAGEADGERTTTSRDIGAFRPGPTSS